MKRYASPFDSTPARHSPKRITSLEHIPNNVHDLSAIGSAVIDLVPPSERKKYAYFRGASLGAAVYNLLEHSMLNTARDLNQPHMHFADGPEAYVYADRTARSIAHGEGFNEIQFPLYMREHLRAATDIRTPDTLPGIVFALDKPFNDYVLDPSTRGAREGVVWHGAVTLDMIDRHSRVALEAILDNVS